MKTITTIALVATFAVATNSLQSESDIIFPTERPSFTTPPRTVTHFPPLNVEYSPFLTEPYSRNPSRNVLGKQYQDVILNFAWKLFRSSKLPNSSDNFVLSPILVQLLLSVLENAAAGETKRQLQEVIGSSSTPEDINRILKSPGNSVQLESATGIFFDASQTLNHSFIEKASKVNANIQQVNFRNGNVAKTIINGWASDATHGLITDILSSSYDVRSLDVVLATAIYFQSTWKYKFNSAGSGTFKTATANRTVDYMEVLQYLVLEYLNYGENLKGIAIEIPYMNDEFSMVLMVPKDDITLDNFIRELDVDTFEKILKNISKNETNKVSLKMPKFKIDSRFSLVNTLIKIGLVDLFTLNVNLPYLGTKTSPQISDIIQQAVLNVDEKGTIATAAATAFLVPLSLNYDRDIRVVIDKPFLSVILDKRNNIPLFISKVYQP